MSGISKSFNTFWPLLWQICTPFLSGVFWEFFKNNRLRKICNLIFWVSAPTEGSIDHCGPGRGRRTLRLISPFVGFIEAGAKIYFSGGKFFSQLRVQSQTRISPRGESEGGGGGAKSPAAMLFALRLRDGVGGGWGDSARGRCTEKASSQTKYDCIKNISIIDAKPWWVLFNWNSFLTQLL